MTRRRSTKAIHIRSADTALAVCGFDWMASLPRSEAVFWTNRDKATCKRCLARVAELIARIGQ